MTKEAGNVLGKAVKEGREKKSLTQQELSEVIDISRNYVSDIECGRYIPSVEKLILLSKVLEIDLNLLKNDGNTL
ncbi:helix-turn-helix transcriptional regulator [Clostridium sp. HBUAS56017]|uniref:helix-turn-helix transcriptional regulator n=1 Tax=Clostridium sp. HBUAS56017 TaxID=2571128 RepID=UPI0011778C22|nr:helix-turn-helix transcriptional regulator [Clostridium sp. HBUAS56017]